ncbi:MAG: MBL fold metallo-hydrolase [Planctomycetia bacterium]|nr:MBL fold metallo-hydrolase [Planctomycetia bacterium]
MKKLIDEMRATKVAAGELAIFYLGQAGFWFKTSNDKNIVIDPYLSDAAERLFGFKRMNPPVIDPNDLDVDYFIATHSHIDHLDTDTLPDVVAKQSVRFIGAPDCEEEFRKQGLSSDRFTILAEGQSCSFDSLSVRAVYADHGELAPDAVGMLIDVDGFTIYQCGDTAYQPERILASLQTTPDIMIAPINGAFGNLNALEACRLAEEIHPRLLIACHFWTFLEHVGENGLGDPSVFLNEAKKLPNDIQAIVLPSGRSVIFKTKGG